MAGGGHPAVHSQMTTVRTEKGHQSKGRGVSGGRRGSRGAAEPTFDMTKILYTRVKTGFLKCFLFVYFCGGGGGGGEGGFTCIRSIMHSIVLGECYIHCIIVGECHMYIG